MATEETTRPQPAQTIWKLVQAGCDQLGETVRSSRLPIVLMLTWALVWFMVLYEVEVGMFKNTQLKLSRSDWAGTVELNETMKRKASAALGRDRLPQPVREALGKCPGRAKETDAFLTVDQIALCETDLRLSDDSDGVRSANAILSFLTPKWTHITAGEVPKAGARSFNWCLQRHHLPDGPNAQLNRAQIQGCAERAARTLDAVFAKQVEAHFVTLPLGIGRTSINDLAVVGPLALLLLLTWSSLAARAEYEAIRGFVDFDSSTYRSPWGSGSVVELIPRNPRLQAEHLAFAYHAVRARLFNTFRQRRQPLKLWNSIVLALPMAVVAWQLWTDVRWLFTPENRELYADFYAKAQAQVLVEVVLAAIAAGLWGGMFSIVHQTSDLLLGWEIATTDVWMSHWNEYTDEAPAAVRMDLNRREVLGIRPMVWPQSKWVAPAAASPEDAAPA